MSADPVESFLTVAEVADWLKLNQQTVRNWIDQGSLPAVRVGRRVRIKRSDLDRILDEGYQGGADVPPPRSAGPSAEDFWSGEPVGVAEPDPTATNTMRSVPNNPEASDGPVPLAGSPITADPGASDAADETPAANSSTS